MVVIGSDWSSVERRYSILLHIDRVITFRLPVLSRICCGLASLICEDDGHTIVVLHEILFLLDGRRVVCG